MFWFSQVHNRGGWRLGMTFTLQRRRNVNTKEDDRAWGRKDGSSRSGGSELMIGSVVLWSHVFRRLGRRVPAPFLGLGLKGSLAKLA